MTKQLSEREYFPSGSSHSLADYSRFYEALVSYNNALNNLRFEIEQCIEKKKTLPDVEMTKLWKWIENHPDNPGTNDGFFSPKEDTLFQLEEYVKYDQRFKYYDWDSCDYESRFHHLRSPSIERDNPKIYQSRLNEALKKYAQNMTTKKQLDSFQELVDQLYRLGTRIHIWSIFSSREEMVEKYKEILGISDHDFNLFYFDLKNTEDIKHCKKLYPLAKKYPDLFYGWYDRDGIIQFDPTYENGLEKKRKEINAKLTEKSKSAKGFKRGIIKVATKIVPEKLGKKTAKMEQKIADVIYRKKQKGRK